MHFPALQDIEKTKEDLIKDMQQYGLTDFNDIFLGEYGSDDFMYICRNGRVFPRPRPKIINYPQ